MTDRQKLITIGLCAIGIYSMGVWAGRDNMARKIRKKFNERQDMLQDAFNNLAGQVMNGTMTRDEIEAYFEEQLNFWQIVSNY